MITDSKEKLIETLMVHKKTLFDRKYSSFLPAMMIQMLNEHHVFLFNSANIQWFIEYAQDCEKSLPLLIQLSFLGPNNGEEWSSEQIEKVLRSLASRKANIEDVERHSVYIKDFLRKSEINYTLHCFYWASNLRSPMFDFEARNVHDLLMSVYNCEAISIQTFVDLEDLLLDKSGAEKFVFEREFLNAKIVAFCFSRLIDFANRNIAEVVVNFHKKNEPGSKFFSHIKTFGWKNSDPNQN